MLTRLLTSILIWCKRVANTYLTSSSRVLDVHQGYVCDFGTTPDPDLEAPEVTRTSCCCVLWLKENVDFC